MDAKTIIERLGGTNAVAGLCEVTPQSVSGWKADGRIPRGWDKYLRLLRPDVFSDQPRAAAQAPQPADESPEGRA